MESSDDKRDRELLSLAESAEAKAEKAIDPVIREGWRNIAAGYRKLIRGKAQKVLDAPIGDPRRLLIDSLQVAHGTSEERKTARSDLIPILLRG